MPDMLFHAPLPLADVAARYVYAPRTYMREKRAAWQAAPCRDDARADILSTILLRAFYC